MIVTTDTTHAPEPVAAGPLPWEKHLAREPGTDAEQEAAFETRRQERVLALQKARRLAVFQTVGWGFFSLLDSRILFLMVVGGVIPFADSFLEGPRLRRLTREQERWEQAFSDWINGKRIVLPLLVPCALLALFALQWFLGLERSIAAAGLVRPAVAAGETWRLLTYGALHANGLHIVYNGIMLCIVMAQVMTLAGPPMAGIVYLTGVIAGGAFSFSSPGGPPTVGASGGILGLLGFITFLTLRTRRDIPAGFWQRLLRLWVIIILVGLLFHEWIDNWAHLGGALSGAGLAWLLVGMRPFALPLAPGRVLTLAGWVAWAVVLVSLALTAARIAGWPA
ncbi:rhomboid family intramembrane serine protease [Myxococcota bacterium]|nr:rhomboid family intramembrane serine protease [Myxococcota bacterium]MBU1413204.1 rhomboid family intramembrane serine protease [Myxococcota bacterium]MBU1511310.1 rhomboid family intramembrane serine protease [Myxococcota bacterium]